MERERMAPPIRLNNHPPFSKASSFSAFMCSFFPWSKFLFRQSIKESGISSRGTELVFHFLDALRLCNTICLTWGKGGADTASGWRCRPGRWPHQKDCGQVRDQREIHQTNRARASPSEWTWAKDARWPWQSAGPGGSQQTWSGPWQLEGSAETF